ncbi:hypothetical protein OTU49_012533, partial [Cherax quadricarinatus]
SRKFFPIPDPVEEGVPLLSIQELEVLVEGKERIKLDKVASLYSGPGSEIVIKTASRRQIINEGVILTRLGDMEGKVPLIGISLETNQIVTVYCGEDLERFLEKNDVNELIKLDLLLQSFRIVQRLH